MAATALLELPLQASPRSQAASTSSTAAVACLLVASGAAGLIYQVAWVRLLGLSFGVTIYAISTVLAAFMGGLAIGSLVGGRRADLSTTPLRLYGFVELATGVTALVTPFAFGALQDIGSVPIATSLAFGALLLPTGLMGATLPLAVRGVRSLRHEGNPTQQDAWAMALLYATNTAGAIVGCLLSGFVLIGKLGLNETIAVAACANAVAGVGGILLDRFSLLPLGGARAQH